MTRAQIIRNAKMDALAALRTLVRVESVHPAGLGPDRTRIMTPAEMADTVARRAEMAAQRTMALSNVRFHARALVQAEALKSDPPPPPEPLSFGGPCADSFCAASCTMKGCFPDRRRSR